MTRYPFWIMQFDAGDLQSLKPWSQGYKILCTYDCKIYVDLAAHYPADMSAFFPGFPLLIRGATHLMPFLTGTEAALLISNLFTILAGALLILFCEKLWANKNYPTFLSFTLPSWIALIAVSVYPDGLFWMRGYSEPLFAALFLGILLCIPRENKWLCCLFAGLIAIVRPQGIWIAGITWLWCLVQSRNWKSLATYSLLALIPFAAFAFWLWVKTGNPFYFLVAQGRWGRHLSLWAGLKEYRPRFDMAVAYLYFSIIASIVFLRRASQQWSFLAICTLALSNLPLFVGGFYSYPRFMSTNLGGFIFFAELASVRPVLGILALLWCMARLAVQVYHGSFGLFIG